MPSDDRWDLIRRLQGLFGSNIARSTLLPYIGLNSMYTLPK